MTRIAPDFARFWLPDGEEAGELQAAGREPREDDSRQSLALEELFERVNAARSVY